ncbi:MAG: COG4315 family predicted lipoprotein [Rhodospirillaceae bacterium]
MKLDQRVVLRVGLAAAAAFISTAALSAGRGEGEFAPLAMPLGITLQPLGIAQGYALSKPTATKLPRQEIIYADAKGMSLYTYDKDLPGKSMCVDECAKTWPPALASKGAKPVANWSVIARADGTQQWAFRNRPLYTYTRDEDIGSVGGNSPKRFGRGPLIGLRGAKSKSIPEDKPLPADWRAAMMYPVEGVDLPSGISIRDVEDAMAMARRRSMPLTAMRARPRKPAPRPPAVISGFPFQRRASRRARGTSALPCGMTASPNGPTRAGRCSPTPTTCSSTTPTAWAWTSAGRWRLTAAITCRKT